MNSNKGWVQFILSRAVEQRHRLPRVVNKLIDTVAKNPDGPMARLADLMAGAHQKSRRSLPLPALNKPIRVLIGPTNYSGQGYLWARALERSFSAVGARNLAVEIPGGFDFAADIRVPLAVYNRSREWQRTEFSVSGGYTHILAESLRPLFGSLFARDVRRELTELTAAGLSPAILLHGTEIRSPRDHVSYTAWSPYTTSDAMTEILQRDADINRAIVDEFRGPIFVSTPDLLSIVPQARWCPVVVDPMLWEGGQLPFQNARPVVAHIPSMGQVKGTQLIEPVLLDMHDRGEIEYRRFSGIPAADMPALVKDADIVLDQFRLGSYGVAAVEAMAAGRLVIGHVTAHARGIVSAGHGQDLPVLEATPETLQQVLCDVLADVERARLLAARGPEFVNHVHSGAASACVLYECWLGK
jgi:hypothetical protein